MNRRHLILSAVPLALAGSAVLAAKPRQPAQREIIVPGVDAEARAYLASGYGVGLSLAAMRDDKLLFAKGYGAANLETQTPVTPATVFSAGSITKQFTGVAIMRLVLAGQLDLDAPAAKYVPEMASLGPITVRILLHQTSGLRNYSGRDFAQQQKIDRSPKEMLDYILALPNLTNFVPGDRFEYSNSNYFILGVIIERVGGRPLATAFDDLIRAAGLTQTAADRATEIVEHRAQGYSLIDGAAGRFRKGDYASMENAGGAGVLRSTPTDLVRWHQALFAGRIIPLNSLGLMLETGKLNSGQPVLREEAPIAQGKPAYGFGLEVGTFDSRKAIGHGGSVFGFTAYSVTFPEQQLSLAIMLNIDPNKQMPFVALLRAMLAATVVQ